MIDVDFREFLISADVLPDADEVPGTLQQNKIDQEGPDTRIWFARNSNTKDLFLSDGFGIETTSFDVECISDSIAAAMELADDVKTAIHGYRGMVGETFAHGIFVEDHTDEYIARNDSDNGIHIAALDVTILH